MTDWGFVPAIQCRDHGFVALTPEQYEAGLDRPDDPWRCPECGAAAIWAGNE